MSPYTADYTDLLEYVYSYLRANQGKVIHVSSHLTSARNDFNHERCASTQQSFPYMLGSLGGRESNKLMLMATTDDELFELYCDRISRLELNEGEVLIEEELGGFFRHNVLRVEA